MMISEKLKEARQKAGMTQDQVAEKIMVSRVTVSHWENGKSLPDIVSLISLSDSEYFEDYETFYKNALRDMEEAKKTREYVCDDKKYPNWFDASYVSWISYDSLNVELPDGYLYFPPIVNWGRYREENGRLMMPVTVRLNHAIADGFLTANVFRTLEREIDAFVSGRRADDKYKTKRGN